MAQSKKSNAKKPEFKSDNRKIPSRNSPLKRIILWIVVIVILYVLTSAYASSQVVEVTKQQTQTYLTQEPIVVEKEVTETTYTTEKTPYGPTRCEQMNYNYTFTTAYTQNVQNGQSMGICTFNVTNQEDIAGDFIFHLQYTRNGNVEDGSDEEKTIDAYSSTIFNWSLSLAPSDTISCSLQTSTPPHREKCFYLEPITYAIQQVPHQIQELKNVTDYIYVNKSRVVSYNENVTEMVYTNKFFGYRQFFWFGY